MNKFERLFEVLPADIDAALITGDVNRRYFTGMKASAGTVLAFKDKAYLIIDFRYIEAAQKNLPGGAQIRGLRRYDLQIRCADRLAGIESSDRGILL